MNMPSFEFKPKRDIDADFFTKAMKAQIDLMGTTGEKLIQEYRDRVASTLLSAGICLIPSDHLMDHQYVVSRGVYDAAKKLARGGE